MCGKLKSLASARAHLAAIEHAGGRTRRRDVPPGVSGSLWENRRAAFDWLTIYSRMGLHLADPKNTRGRDLSREIGHAHREHFSLRNVRYRFPHVRGQRAVSLRRLNSGLPGAGVAGYENQSHDRPSSRVSRVGPKGVSGHGSLIP